MWHGNALIMNNKHQLSIPSKASNLSPSLSIMSRDFSCSNNIVRKNVKVPESSALLITEERYIYIYIYRCFVSSNLHGRHGNRWLWHHCVSIHPDLTRSWRHSQRKVCRNHGHWWLWRHCLISVQRPPLTRLWMHPIKELYRNHGNRLLRWHCLITIHP